MKRIVERRNSVTFSRKEVRTTNKEKDSKDVIAYRKACDASGAGLSHYILMEKKSE